MSYMHELPLVFFTVLGQLSAGMVLIGGISSLSHYSYSLIKINKMNMAALIVMAVAMLIASLHLGHPFRALNVIWGIGRSPMSNEIFSFGLLFGITLVCVLLTYFSYHNDGKKWLLVNSLCQRIYQIPNFSKILSLLLIFFSLIFVWMIALTYMLPTVKTWNTYYTAIQMYTSMLVLGGIAAIVFGIFRIGIISFFTGVISILLLKIPYINLMTSVSPELTSKQYIWMLIQCLLLVLALVLVIVNIYRSKQSTIIYSIAFIIVLVAELCGRIAFYNLWTIQM
ncbi:MAG: dimethyl sulfoxide reductase anchor subunit [Gilliamella sp.]|uniref:dimethyl sulfoxide reductase anchor subunit family protein n=1 Tax=Gilliamella sp. TaxID=1891236 RepID=UPI0025EEBAA1|nr:DmsC/YnfH family molybdoenzyme membrane anchor subunit [Gilliamella sp.]MCO6540276.1 dimethyl sulfoxide reductase anchor subunit [Gilliamella sp.]